MNTDAVKLEEFLKKWQTENNSNKLLLLNKFNVTELPFIPYFVSQLVISNMPLRFLPPMGHFLTYLNISNLSITKLPYLPNSITVLKISQCPNLEYIRNFPSNLRKLTIYSTAICGLPDFPPKLEQFYCDDNPIEILPILPKTLRRFKCSCPLLVKHNPTETIRQFNARQLHYIEENLSLERIIIRTSKIKNELHTYVKENKKGLLRFLLQQKESTVW